MDFATTESPYRDANKGWLNDDVYIQWGKEQEFSSKSGVELAKVSVSWSPINQLASILLAVFFLTTSFVFLAVSLSHGRLNILGTTAKASYDPPLVVEREIDLEEVQQTNLESALQPAPIIESEVQLPTTQKSAEFSAAALGGQKMQSQ